MSKNVTFEARDFRNDISKSAEFICNTDGKINMVCNPVIDYLKGEIDEEQLNNRLYRALEQCMDIRRKYDNVQFNDCTINTTAERCGKMTYTFMSVLQKIRTNYMECFEEEE